MCNPVQSIREAHEMTAQRQPQDDDLRPAETDRILFDEVDTMVCTLALDGTFMSINPAGEKLTGYTAAQLVGRPAVELIAPELRDQATQQFRSRLATSAARSAQETILVTRSGARVPIEVASAVLRQNGRAVGLLGLVRDLTERQSTREVLRQSDERFRSAFESAAIGMAVVATDGVFLQVNASLCELVGYTVDELLSRTFQDITHPDDLATDIELLEHTLAGEIRTYQLEKRYLHRDGHVVWALLSVSLVRQSDDSPLHFISQIQDISERKQAEETVARSEAQLAEAQHIAHVGSWEWNIDANTITWSAELFHIFGVDPGAGRLTYERYLEAIHPDDRARVEAMIAAATTTRVGFSIEHRVLRHDGTISWVHGRAEVTQGKGGPIRMRGTAQDITERKEAEEQLRQAELRYRTLVEQLPLTTYIRPLDMSLPNIYCSPQVEQLLGSTAAEWETDPGMFESMVHPDDRDRAVTNARHIRDGGTSLRDEYRYIARDGRVVWVLDETYLVHDENGEPCIQGYLLDVSERKQIEEERGRLQEELYQAQKLEAIGRLAGGVAHDFNNMLTAITGYSELLLAQLDDDSPLRAEALQIGRAAEQASALPRQLLAFSRNQPLQPRLVDLDEVVAAASNLLSRLVGETIDVTVTSTSTSSLVVVDPAQIEHVLLNLVLNARDAMPDGGSVRIETANVELTEQSAAERSVPPGSYVVVSVADTGEGIDVATKARMFEPFFTTKPAGKGAGLGLASVYGVISQSGGFVDVTSTPGKGSRFEVFLPCSTEERVTPDATTPIEPPPIVETTLTGTVLLAEDEEVVRTLAVTVLEKAGFKVVAAANGVEALALWEATPGIDVLVSDMVMPGLGGRELAERILASAPGIAVVLMSGYTTDGQVSGSGVDGGPELLQKPFAPSTLVNSVAAALLRAARETGLDGG
jgi:two-component system, cell cycle sensor histidine kinase and response regulator CckA